MQDTGSILLGSGTYIVQRSTPNNVSFISSPINNETVSGFGITPTGTNGGQIIPNTTNPCNPDSIDATSAYGNLLEMREDATVIGNCAQSLWFVKSAGNLTDGRGYSFSGSPGTLSFTGTINNDTITYAGLTRQAGTIDQQDGSTSTRGWHLVGNPYPSPITLTGANLTGMGFDAQIQRYNDATGNWISNDPLVSADMAVGQGFQIRKTSVGGTSDFVLDNTFRTTGNPTFYKNGTRDHYLNITLDNGSMTDNTMVYFYDGATEGFDPLYDANRLMGNFNNPLLYTVTDNERLSYNAYPLLVANEERTVTLGVHDGVAGNFTLTFNDLATLDADVTLEDLQLNTITPITEGMVYNFTTADGDVNERFVLHFNKTATPTGIGSVTNSNIKLYPNPVKDNLVLELPAEHTYTSALVMDITGKVISTTNLTTQTGYTIPTTALASGIYYVKLLGAYSTTVKFIKQ